MFQFSFMYGDVIYLPYSLGMLWAYAKTFQRITDKIKNNAFTIIREDPDRIVEQIIDPDIVAFSTYVWNFEMSLAVAKLIKRKHPECLVVFGGPQIPNTDRLGDFFLKYPFIDIVVHGEGEITFSEILLAYANDSDYKDIAGITYRGHSSNDRPRTKDLSIFPSPYLTGVFDDLIKLPYTYHTIWETDRGCPYRCTFCDWGSLTGQKMYQFDEDRVYAELEVFAQMKISYVYMGNANFGIFPRDVEIAQHAVDTNIKYNGYPQKIRANFTKNSSSRVFDIAKLFNAQGLDKGITLSVQSLDEVTLKTIKRSNMKFDTLASFVQQYTKENIDTLIELIIGLPGETYSSFKSNLEDLLDIGVHNSIAIYNCTLLPNAPMSDTKYILDNGIETMRTPIMLSHAILDDPIQEYEETITQTNTLSAEDIKRCILMSWALQAFHVLGLTQAVSICLYTKYNIAYTVFYEHLIRYAMQFPETVVGQEYIAVRGKIDNNYEATDVVPEYDTQECILSEASYLRIHLQLDTFFNELPAFFTFLQKSIGTTVDDEFLSDLTTYQKAIVITCNNGTDEFTLNNPIHAIFHDSLANKSPNLHPIKNTLRISDPNNFDGDISRFATEIVHWGRRGGKTLHYDVVVTY